MSDTTCPNEKCGHAAEDHGAFTCWKGCGCGFGKWDLDPWCEDKPAPKEDPETARPRRRVETLEKAGFDLACTVSAFLVDARKRLGPEWTSALDVLTRDLDAYNDAADGRRAGKGTKP